MRESRNSFPPSHLTLSIKFHERGMRNLAFETKRSQRDSDKLSLQRILFKFWREPLNLIEKRRGILELKKKHKFETEPIEV